MSNEMYIGFDGREYEDAEMDAMRRDAYESMQEASFTVRYLDDMTLEYDHSDGSLRLCWPGRQVFLAHNELESLHALLNEVL